MQTQHNIENYAESFIVLSALWTTTQFLEMARGGSE